MCTEEYNERRCMDCNSYMTSWVAYDNCALARVRGRCKKLKKTVQGHDGLCDACKAKREAKK